MKHKVIALIAVLGIMLNMGYTYALAASDMI